MPGLSLVAFWFVTSSSFRFISPVPQQLVEPRGAG
jgi:hypothetical protein